MKISIADPINRSRIETKIHNSFPADFCSNAKDKTKNNYITQICENTAMSAAMFLSGIVCNIISNLPAASQKSYGNIMSQLFVTLYW